MRFTISPSRHFPVNIGLKVLFVMIKIRIPNSDRPNNWPHGRALPGSKPPAAQQLTSWVCPCWLLTGMMTLPAFIVRGARLRLHAHSHFSTAGCSTTQRSDLHRLSFLTFSSRAKSARICIPDPLIYNLFKF